MPVGVVGAVRTVRTTDISDHLSMSRFRRDDASPPCDCRQVSGVLTNA
jgi:hypothetical protein